MAVCLSRASLVQGLPGFVHESAYGVVLGQQHGTLQQIDMWNGVLLVGTMALLLECRCCVHEGVRLGFLTCSFVLVDVALQFLPGLASCRDWPRRRRAQIAKNVASTHTDMYEQVAWLLLK